MAGPTHDRWLNSAHRCTRQISAGSGERTSVGRAAPPPLQDAGQFVMHTKVFNAVVPLIIMLRMFKAFSAQPRLALVTETLRKAWTNLAHYLIVFGAIFASYACMGVAFFGRQSSSFATLDRAIPTMFLMMLGGFDFADLEISGRGYAFFFFATFMFLIVLVMLSMLIAIIMDVYVDVKQSSKSSEPVWVCAHNILRRAIQNAQKRRVNLNKVLAVIQAEDARLLRTAMSTPGAILRE